MMQESFISECSVRYIGESDVFEGTETSISETDQHMGTFSNYLCLPRRGQNQQLQSKIGRSKAGERNTRVKK